MHFTRTQLLNLPFFLYRSIDKMASTIQKKPSSQQQACLFHHSLIKIVILHQLEKKGISWDTFISHPDFATTSSSHAFPSPSTHPLSPSSSKPTPKKQKSPMIDQEEEHSEKEQHSDEEEHSDKEKNSEEDQSEEEHHE